MPTKKNIKIFSEVTFHRLPHDMYYKIHLQEVEVMAIVENYAMVRAEGCTPFVCDIKDLKDKS